ncbi:MAG TPA: hypothetical protein VFF58_00265 [Candidatus Nitrosotalea sp.]|nr:hypothetical protein [Candidatus Nitrosotalea sp.]
MTRRILTTAILATSLLAPLQAQTLSQLAVQPAPAPAPKKHSWIKALASSKIVAQGVASIANNFGQTGEMISNAVLSRTSAMASGLVNGRQPQSNPMGFPAAAAATTDEVGQAPVQQPYWMSDSGEIKAAPPQTSAQPSEAASQARQGAIVMFTPWRDPRENGFTVNVPQGWQISGGTTRTSPIDPHQVLRATSPDGRMHLFFGDPNLIPREVPNRLLAFAGIREGQMTRGDVGPILIARYQTGEQFARTYISHMCPAAQVLSSGMVPDATRELAVTVQQYARVQGAPAQSWVGEATFRCGAQTGYVRASTVLAGPPTAAQVWAVLEVSGFMVADPSQAAFARYILNTIIGSVQMNPQWEARQAQTTRDVSGAVTRAQQQMAASIAQHGREQASRDQIDVMSGWEKRSKAFDATMARDSEVRRGTTTATDDYTGTSRTVSNDYNYYWTRPDNSIVGTMTDTPPDYSSGWRMMTAH